MGCHLRHKPGHGNPIVHRAVQRAHGYGAGLLFLGPAGENQRRLGQLGFADFAVEAFRAVIHLDSKAGLDHIFSDILGKRNQIIVDGQ